MRSFRVVVLSAILAQACYTGPSSPAEGAESVPSAPEESSQQGAPLALGTAPLSLAGAPVGRPVGVVELGDDVVAFGDAGVIVVSGGVARAVEGAPTGWTSVAGIRAPDGSGTWAVGVTVDGRVMRLRARESCEDVTSRFGLDAGSVREVEATADGRTIFATSTGLVVLDASGKSRVFAAGPWSSLAVSGARVAGIVGGEARVLDLVTERVTAYPVGEARAVALDPPGRLVVLTDHALLRERNGQLEVRVARPDAIMSGLAITGERVWFGVGEGLVVLDGDEVRPTAGGPALGAGPVTLAAATGGALWVFSRSVSRVSVAARSDETVWNETVLPVFARACEGCHRAGGSAGIDLSTYAAWTARRAVIRERVVVQRNMPPTGPLDDAATAAISAWTSSSP